MGVIYVPTKNELDFSLKNKGAYLEKNNQTKNI